MNNSIENSRMCPYYNNGLCFNLYGYSDSEPHFCEESDYGNFPDDCPMRCRK